MKAYTPQLWNFGPKSKLVILTGAGISAESGIRTFRDSGGLWEDHRVEDVATPEGFARNPGMVIEFYNQRRLELSHVRPNPAHEAIACLGNRLAERLLLVTQNIDNLHERGGSKQVEHMHGELLKLRCLRDERHVIDFAGVQNIDFPCPQCGAKMRPHIVWFGEIPFDMDAIQDALQCCTHFVFVGTSSQVYPAAGFRKVAKAVGAKVLCINLEVEADDPYTDLIIQGKAGIEVPLWVDSMP